MVEVEDVKSERCRGTYDRCREPPGTEELDAFGRRAVTVTVFDNKTVDAGEVEDHEVAKGGGVGTRVTNVVSELKNKTEGCECGVFKEAAVPFLKGRQRRWVVKKRCQHTYLNPVERGGCVA